MLDSVLGLENISVNKMEKFSAFLNMCIYSSEAYDKKINLKHIGSEECYE